MTTAWEKGFYRGEHGRSYPKYAGRDGTRMAEESRNTPWPICLIAEASTRSQLEDYLMEAGFVVCAVGSIHDAARSIARREPTVCILDLDLPRLNRPTIIRELADKYAFLMIVMSSQCEHSDRILGLELGADEYLPKSIDPSELVARVRALIRRRERDQTPPGESRSTAKFGDWAFLASTLELVAADGQRHQLTAAEAELLRIFIRRPNCLLTREQLQGSDALKDDPAYARSIDVRISRMRKILERDPRAPCYIKTVYGAGYIFAAGVEWK